MSLRFYNTLTLQVEEFQPADGKTVRMYTCGPTVWNYVHIGNLRTFTFQDILRRWLRARGYTLDHVMNITDVDDRIIQQSTAAGQTLDEYTKGYAAAFLEDTAALRLERPERMVRATEHIPAMVELIERLEKSGYTYQSEGSVYYKIEKFPQYGKLSHADFAGQKDGARVDTDKYDKENARDFVLWKGRKEGEPYWDTPFGPGRPGWHIECSAMAMRYLGETLDIHAGGIDLTFPHHENEIAQSEAATGKPFARFWLHSEHLMIGGATMSKSAGNFYTLRDLLAEGWHPEAIRFLLASVPYRKKQVFTIDALQSAATAIERLRNYKLRLDSGKFAEGLNQALLERTNLARRDFDNALDDDLNTAEALAAIFEFVRDTNTAMDSGEFKAANVEAAQWLLSHFDSIFDVLRTNVAADALSDAGINALIEERVAAKKARNFQRADAIRTELLEKGVILEDTKDGTRWKRK